MKVKNLNSHIEHIVNGYRQQYHFYQQLLQLAGRQSLLVSENDIEEIQEVLCQKGEVINSIREIENNISQHKEAVKNLLHIKEFKLDKVQELIQINLRNELNALREAHEKIINQIIETDRKNEETLKNCTQDVVKELKSIQQHYDIQQAYFDRPEKFPEPRFFDKKK